MLTMNKKLTEYSIGSDSGIRLSCLNYGGVLKSLSLPVNGERIETLLGYQSAQQYLQDKFYLGAVIGRYSNRIANAQFSQNGKTYHLEANDGNNNLHGGSHGLHQKYWQLDQATENAITFKCESPDGEGGFPGNVKFTLRYQIASATVTIDLFAETDQETPINLTGHAYFNLNRENHQSIENHQLAVYSDSLLVSPRDGIPTGEMKPVDATDFDFRELKTLDWLRDSKELMIQQQSGLDHNFVFANKTASSGSVKVATLYSPQTHIELTVSSNMPGLQVYSGNHLTIPFSPHQGICLEPQYYPDSPNHSDFPSCLVKPGDVYHHQIKYHFNLKG
jgi:aldose 1-epimerase